MHETWVDSAYARASYVEGWPSDALVASVEAELGYRLPASYVALMRTQNGGRPKRTCFRVPSESFADGYLQIRGLRGIGRDKRFSLCGARGSAFTVATWSYPPIGVCIADADIAGRGVIMLDYRACGPRGEPVVTYLSKQRHDIVLAKDFEPFLRGLVDVSEREAFDEHLTTLLKAIDEGPHGEEMRALLTSDPPLLSIGLRRLCHDIAKQKRCFALEADEASCLVYDLQFSLYSRQHDVRDAEAYLRAYPRLHVFEAPFAKEGVALKFVESWLRARCEDGQIVTTSAGLLRLDEAYERALLKRVRNSPLRSALCDQDLFLRDALSPERLRAVLAEAYGLEPAYVLLRDMDRELDIVDTEHLVKVDCFSYQGELRQRISPWASEDLPRDGMWDVYQLAAALETEVLVDLDDQGFHALLISPTGHATRVTFDDSYFDRSQRIALTRVYTEAEALPELEGALCERVVEAHSKASGEPCHVLYLRASGRWHALGVHGGLGWCPDFAPDDEEDPDGRLEYVDRTLFYEVANVTLQRVAFSDKRLQLEFANGVTITVG